MPRNDANKPARSPEQHGNVVAPQPALEALRESDGVAREETEDARSLRGEATIGGQGGQGRAQRAWLQAGEQAGGAQGVAQIEFGGDQADQEVAQGGRAGRREGVGSLGFYDRPEKGAQDLRREGP